MMNKRKKPYDPTVINAAALQDHILRTANFSLKPLLRPPRVVPIAAPALKVIAFQNSEKSGSAGRTRLPKLTKPKFQFEEEEEQNHKKEVQMDLQAKQAYNKKLTLAQKLGLIAPPPKPMTLEEWEEVEEQSKKREEGLCPICLEKFKNQEHIILSCSHVFHKACLESFERFNKMKVCPICRRQDYEKKRYVYAHRAFAIKSAILIQCNYRGYICRVRLYECLIGEGYKSVSTRFRRRLMFFKLSKVSAKLQKNVAKRQKNVENEVDELGKQYEQRKVVMDEQILQIQHIKQANHEQGVEALDRPQQNMESKITPEDWAKIREKGLKRCDKECVICYQSLQSKKGVYLLSCSHFFHAACLNAFERYSVKSFQTCPVCRSEYQKIHINQ